MPAATAVLYALGLGHKVVEAAHECDWPPEAASCRPFTAALLDTDELDSAEIDRAVSDAAAQEKPLYAVDAKAYCSSPGPRPGVGAELLGRLLHPEAVPDPGVPWARPQI